ncbi:MAG: 50S ribosomal protein L6 [Canidatus Methanoxibalbensis ujae]|nr:50S ribosomal protein L6 [Candidatus Methanoxibalbensis ujae]
MSVEAIEESERHARHEGYSVRVPVPDDVEVEIIDGRKVRVSGPKGVLERELWYPDVKIVVVQRRGADEEAAGEATETSAADEETEETEETEGGRSITEIVVSSDTQRRKKKAIVGTFAAHIRNMIIGVREGFYYKLRVFRSHFPIQVSVSKDSVIISNFLGERKSRIAKILEGVSVEIRKGEGGKEETEIIVRGINKESVGQTAANIERATRIKRRDPRVFQDGIYIVEKGTGEA